MVDYSKWDAMARELSDNEDDNQADNSTQMLKMHLNHLLSERDRAAAGEISLDEAVNTVVETSKSIMGDKAIASKDAIKDLEQLVKAAQDAQTRANHLDNFHQLAKEHDQLMDYISNCNDPVPESLQAILDDIKIRRADAHAMLGLDLVTEEEFTNDVDA